MLVISLPLDGISLPQRAVAPRIVPRRATAAWTDGRQCQENSMPIITRTEKLDLRLTPSAKRVLQSAANAARRSVSEFVLESALARAEETLPDRQRFGIDAERWAAFQAVLDAPALVVAQVEYDDAPQRLGNGLARQPIPLMLLARQAVATRWQGKGLGSGLLKDAMLRTLQAADIAGIRAMAVHAKDDDLRAFYERFGFVPAPTDPYHLFVLLKDVRAILEQR